MTIHWNKWYTISYRGVQPFGICGPHWKKKSCLGPPITYTNTNENKKKTKSHNVLSKFTILCWAEFIAILSRMQLAGRRLDTPDCSFGGYGCLQKLDLLCSHLKNGDSPSTCAAVWRLTREGVWGSIYSCDFQLNFIFKAKFSCVMWLFYSFLCVFLNQSLLIVALVAGGGGVSCEGGVH